MSESILNVTKHPVTGASLASWVLWAWERDPNQSLLILTPEGEGKSYAARIRNHVSLARGSLKASGIETKEFGFKSAIIRWQDMQGNRYEGVCLTRIVSLRYTMREAMKQVGRLGKIERTIHET